MQLNMKSGPTMDCDFTVEEYLAHLLDALQVTNQVLVVDVRKGVNKEYIYTSQGEDSNCVNAEPEQKDTHNKEYLYMAHADTKCISIEPRQQKTSTSSNINEELTLDDISNFIMKMDDIFNDIEN